MSANCPSNRVTTSYPNGLISILLQLVHAGEAGRDSETLAREVKRFRIQLTLERERESQ